MYTFVTPTGRLLDSSTRWKYVPDRQAGVHCDDHDRPRADAWDFSDLRIFLEGLVCDLFRPKRFFCPATDN